MDSTAIERIVTNESISRTLKEAGFVRDCHFSWASSPDLPSNYVSYQIHHHPTQFIANAYTAEELAKYIPSDTHIRKDGIVYSLQCTMNDGLWHTTLTSVCTGPWLSITSESLADAIARIIIHLITKGYLTPEDFTNG